MQTNFYERPFAPEKGANLRGYLFEPMSNLVANVLQSTIRNMIASYEPRVRIETIFVRPNFDMDTYEIELRFFVIGISSPQTLVAQLKRLR